MEIHTTPPPATTLRSMTTALYAPCLLGTLFMAAAGAHRLQQADLGAYRQSLLIPLEFLLLIAAAGTLLVTLPACLALLFTRKWRLLGHATASSAITVGLIIAGVQLDAAALL